MNQLEAIRTKVIEAVPEIETEHRKKVWYYENEHLDSSNWYWKKYKKVRPISLADVLRAIGKRGNGNENPDYFVTDTGLLCWKPWGQATTHQKLYWNLAIPLEEQEPEVITFLANILCV